MLIAVFQLRTSSKPGVSTQSCLSGSAQSEPSETEEKSPPTEEERFYITPDQMAEFLDLRRQAQQQVPVSSESSSGYTVVDHFWFDGLLLRVPLKQKIREALD